jgi:hypothetical protein
VTTLAAAVDAVDKLWTIDTMPDAPFLEAGDELVEISARFPEHIYAPTQETIPAKIRVRRAAAGTTAAIHAQGITLTPVYPESSSSAGSEQTIRLLGPYRVNYNDVGLRDPDNFVGVRISNEPLTEDMVVLKVWAEYVTQWAGSDGNALDASSLFIVVENAARDSSFTVSAYALDNRRSSNTPDFALTTAQPSADPENIIRVKTTGYFAAVWDLATATATAGATDVYALIAEPAV